MERGEGDGERRGRRREERETERERERVEIKGRERGRQVKESLRIFKFCTRRFHVHHEYILNI